MKKYHFINIFVSAIFSIVILVFWELYSNSFTGSRLFLPAPTSVITAFSNNWDIILFHTYQTVLETIIGFILALIFGFGISLIFAISSSIRKMIYPFLIISQTVPLIVFAPLLLIWFGFGITPKIIMVVLYCFFPITIAATDALVNVEKNLINLMLSMNAGKLQILKLVRIPSSMPAFFSGLKIAATYSVTGAIVGEFVGAYQGIGVYMKMSANSHAFSLVFASIITVIIFSMLLFGIVSILEKLIIPWHFRKSGS